MLVINIALAVPIAGGIGFLLIHQFFTLLTNTTTIEESVRKWQEIDAKKANEVHSYDTYHINFQSLINGLMIMVH
jgi:hypothetical protein